MQAARFEPPANPEVNPIQMGEPSHEFPPPTKPVGGLFIVSILVAQFVFFVALLGPAIVAIQVKATNMFPGDTAKATNAIAIVTTVGAAGALLANVIFGQLSDRTMSRFGRRRPWIVGGTIVMTIAFVMMGFTQSVPVLTIGWFLAQCGANATLAPFIATLSDQVPELQRAKLSSWIGIAQNVAILVATWLAQALQHNMPMLFIGPSVLAIVAMAWYAKVLPDQVRTHKPHPLDLGEFLRTFWVNPIKYPDYALAWFGRFLITLGSFMFTTFRLLFLENRLELTQEKAVGVITISVLIYTAALVVSSYIGGMLSDRTGRRKIFVFIASAVFGVGLVLLAHTYSIGMFYVVEGLMGLAYGIYVGVDLALVIDVLPNPDNAGKDLGVFNMANALPQSLAPAFGAVLVGVGSANSTNYSLLAYAAGIACILGAILVIPIKKVR